MMMRIFFSLTLVVVLHSSCLTITTQAPQQSTLFYKNSNEQRTRADYTAHSNDGMVATAHRLASQIGRKILQQGGNAVDAAVASSFAISVVRPQSTGIGGGGFMLLHRPGQEPLAFDFRERAPAGATRMMFVDDNGQARNFSYRGAIIPEASVNGHLSVGTPGLIAGLIYAHELYGSLPLRVLIEPSIELARQGFAVYPELEQAIVERANILKHFAGSRQIFLPNDRPLKTGDWLIQKDLAWTLEQIAQFGAAGFYNGEVARKIIAEIKQGKGILSAEDLANYRVKNRTPLEALYRGHRIVAMPPPSSGGVHIIEMLNMLSHYDIKSLGHFTPQSIHILAEVMKRAFADRAHYLGDPDFVQVPTERLVSTEHANAWRRSIKLDQASKADELMRVHPFAMESPSTTHISVVDKAGMAVSTTQTINYAFGSCVTAEGTGVVLNDEMDDFSIQPGLPNVYGLMGTDANAVLAHKTMLSSMSPTLVFDRHGELELVVGSPGGPRIINATLQTIINVLDHEMSLIDAVHSYRIHHQWLPDHISIEAGAITPDLRRELMARGHTLKEIKSIGDVQAIQIIRTHEQPLYIGVSDTRSNGQPL